MITTPNFIQDVKAEAIGRIVLQLPQLDVAYLADLADALPSIIERRNPGAPPPALRFVQGADQSGEPRRH